MSASSSTCFAKRLTIFKFPNLAALNSGVSSFIFFTSTSRPLLSSSTAVDGGAAFFSKSKTTSAIPTASCNATSWSSVFCSQFLLLNAIHHLSSSRSIPSKSLNNSGLLERVATLMAVFRNKSKSLRRSLGSSSKIFLKDLQFSEATAFWALIILSLKKGGSLSIATSFFVPISDNLEHILLLVFEEYICIVHVDSERVSHKLSCLGIFIVSTFYYICKIKVTTQGVNNTGWYK